MKALKIFLIKKNIRQQELVKGTGFSQSTISRLCNDIAEPSKEQKRRIAKALRVSIKHIWNKG
jgi:transcriptional regulator with XRE-family HTH domain